MFRVAVRARARKQLKKIRASDSGAYKKLADAIDTLAAWPSVGNVNRLHGHPFHYRLRVGRYRILFDVDQHERLILIQKVAKRDDRTY